MHADVDKGRGADRDQHMGAQTAAALTILALGPDQSAEHEGREQADQRIKKIADREGMKKRHFGPAYRS